MADRPPISYANSIDPAGGITPTRDIAGRPLAQALDAGASFNAHAEAVPARTATPPPIPSEQVRQTRLSPDGPKPPQPYYNANAAYAHVSRANRDHDRAYAQVLKRPLTLGRTGRGSRTPPALSPEDLQRLNYRFNAAKDQTERMEARKQERKHGKRR